MYKKYEPKFSVLKGPEAEKIAKGIKKHAEISIFLDVNFDRLFALPEAKEKNYIVCDEYPPQKENLKFFVTKQEALDCIKNGKVSYSTFIYRNQADIGFML